MQRKRHTYIAALSAKSDAFDDMHRQSLQCRGRVCSAEAELQCRGRFCRKCKLVTCMLMAITSEGLHRCCQGLSRHQLIQREIPVDHIFPACKAYAWCIMTLVNEN